MPLLFSNKIMKANSVVIIFFLLISETGKPFLALEQYNPQDFDLSSVRQKVPIHRRELRQAKVVQAPSALSQKETLQLRRMPKGIHGQDSAQKAREALCQTKVPPVSTPVQEQERFGATSLSKL